MVLIAWNMRGMNSDACISENKTMLMSKRIDMMGLNETKIKGYKQYEVKCKFYEDWKFHTNFCSHGGQGG